MRKLIIWDFDGVISDSEKLWIENWQFCLKEILHIDWDLKKCIDILGGIAEKTKIERLREYDIIIDQEFLDYVHERDIKLIEQFLEPIDGVEKIFKLNNFDHCVATGGTMVKTLKKIKKLEFEKYFNNNIFTAEMVEKGKPDPDLFLYSMEQMKQNPENCFIIEDSVAGIKAGINAKIKTIAFIGNSLGNNPEYLKQIEDLKPYKIFDNMKNLYNFFKNE